jgi:hypothetical protein
MVRLSPEIRSSFNSALKKLTGYSRREYAAELCATYFENSARKMERGLQVSREMILLGQKEQQTGIRCLDAYCLRGVKKKKTSIQP